MFITFEGIDGSGKTTQINLLSARLRSLGIDVLALREPGGNDVSENIREVLLSNTKEIGIRAELLLFVAARAQLVEKVIEPALHAGKLVICDRFIDSSVAYQGFGRGIDISDVHTCNKFATNNLVPNLTFFLDVPTTVGLGRTNARGENVPDRMESAGENFFDNVRQGYLSIAESDPDRFIVLDGGATPEEIHDNIWVSVYKQVKQHH
ncbi:MAG: dTMP kinase [Candidatus Kapaibacterium sp.]